MTKEKFVKFIVYLILSVLIALFVLSVVNPEKFSILLKQTDYFLHKTFETKGWILLLSVLLSLIGLIKLIEFIISFKPTRLPYHKYRHDTFKGALWRWEWRDFHVENLWCYCPTCNQELSYKCDHLLFKTEFLCQRCEKHLCSYDGDNINYVLSHVKREVRRLAQKQLKNL